MLITNNKKSRSMKFLNLLIVLFLLYNFGSSRSSSCGELGNITYPYHLPGTCNWKVYELQCNGHDTVLSVGPTTYLVKNMSIENKTLRLVDPDLAEGRCCLQNQDFLFGVFPNNVFDLFATPGFDFRLGFITFFNCTEELKDSTYKLIHCMDEPRSRIYAGFGRSYDQAGSIPKSCAYVAMTETYSDVPMRWNDTEGVELMRILRQGIVVSWNITEMNFFYGPEYNKKTCSLLKHCWGSAKSNFKYVMRHKYSSTGSKLHYLLSVQTSFLECFQQPPGFVYPNMKVVFDFMLILVVLFDILLILLGIRLTFVPCTILVFLLHKYKKVSLSINYVEKFLRKHEMLAIRRYDFIEIAIMTNHFKEKLGQGGFGSVYKGKLISGCQVAVKILTNSSSDGDDFISEVATIGRIHHANIVRLIGFCSEGSKRALVYPYMPKGSLDKYIFSSSNNYFSMEKKREIALGIARGIDYLHRGCQMQILHFDIKPHNILLDHDLTPKISDFGLAKLYSREYNLVTLNTARGTIGYIAPELISRAFGAVSYKADVYSFGMLLMEMASGRRNVDNHAESSNQVYYPSWIYDQLILADETPNYNSNNCVAQFGETEGILYKVALWCIQMRASDRPSMIRVIEMLQSDADSLEMPPRPFTTCSSDEVPVSCSQVDSCSIELSSISEEISLL